jgi:hypothetical protein
MMPSQTLFNHKDFRLPLTAIATTVGFKFESTSDKIPM